MFHFPELASCKLFIHLLMSGHDSRRVAPFRNPRLSGCLAPPRGLSQLTTSFFAFRRQGIHPMLLSTCFARKKLPSFPIQLSMSRPRRVRQAHAWVTYRKHLQYPFKHGSSVFVVGLDRLELSTSRLSGVRSNHLSYRPVVIWLQPSHWWSWTGLNRRPPACKADALPAELQPHLLHPDLQTLPCQ